MPGERGAPQRSRRARATWSLIVVVACERRPAADESGRPPAVPVVVEPPPPECRPTPQGEVLAQWVAPDRCSWVVTAIPGGVRLESLSLQPPPPVEGPAPPCKVAACRYEGIDTDVGPVLVVTEPSAESDVPASVFVGVVAGGTLAFVDLWAGAGAPVREDATLVGPAYALEPRKCGGGVGFVVAPRVRGAFDAPPPSLLARQGVLALDRPPTVAAAVEGEPAQVQLTATAPNGCSTLQLPLP
jgi:hypothetical protein